MKRDELVAYLDELLKVDEIEDSAQNGLQVEGAAEVDTVAFAVDASLATFEGALEAEAQMLVAHHGIFWGKPILVRGPFRERLKMLLDADLNLYAVHLPLDLHPELGNNAGLADLFELKERIPFGEYRGRCIGVGGRLPQPLSRERLIALLTERLGVPLRVLPFGASEIHRVAVCSGGAAELVVEAAEAGYEVFLTGEPSHTFFHEACERGVNVVYCGHYLTETLGPKALMDHLAEQFGLRTLWLDVPTGL